MKVPLNFYELSPFGIVLIFISNYFHSFETLIPHNKKRLSLVIKVKSSIQSPLLIELFPQYHSNFEEEEEFSGSFYRNATEYKEQSVTKHT